MSINSIYVKLRVFVGIWGDQGRWVNKIFLQVYGGHLCLLSPLELVMFLEEHKELESSNVESRDDPTQGSHTPRQIMNIIEALRRPHLGDG
jgi:hypothetical protein